MSVDSETGYRTNVVPMRGGNLAVGDWCDWVTQVSAQAAVNVNHVAFVTAEWRMREGLRVNLPAGETAGNGAPRERPSL